MESSKFVFVSYSQEDRERVGLLVDLLDRKLREIGGSIFWDAKLRAGTPLSEAIHKLLSEAACVIVVWTKQSVGSQWVVGECEAARLDGRLVPVVMDKDTQVRPPFNVMKHVELIGWSGAESPEFLPLWESVRDLVERGVRVASYGSLAENPWVIQGAEQASDHLRHLTGRFRDINEVLVANSPPIQDLREAINQVLDTYRAVTAAVQRFTGPALKAGPFDPQPYLELAHGDLPREIQAGRGHCGKILVHYRRVGGVRDAIEGRLSDHQLRDVDNTFEKLGTADGDAFQQMTLIGDYLRNESRGIVNSLLAHQVEVARQRVAAAYRLLEPLEQKLTVAMNEIELIQASLGQATSR